MERRRAIVDQTSTTHSATKHLLALINAIREDPSTIIGGPQLRHAIRLSSCTPRQLRELGPILAALEDKSPRLYGAVRDNLIIARRLTHKTK